MSVIYVCCFAMVMPKQVNYYPLNSIYSPYGGRVSPLFVYQIWSRDLYSFKITNVPKFQNWVTWPRPHRRRGCFMVPTQAGSFLYLCTKNEAYSLIRSWGTGIRGLMRGMAILPQGNQELSVVRDKVGRPPGELGVSESMECDIFPFSALTMLVGDRKGIRPVKNWMLVCWW